MISLRAYNNEIEQMIDNGHYEESIAHCRYILTKFPKCIDTYRNLGKTLLEIKKYPEALDIFSRVLSAYPDDFISHVGLSIIYEDQNDLDLAIWHMEQSFDVQPSNLAIQEELKRLFGLRDGEQPLKIRLTRGALVRMYARGELYQQAITEINSILEEDPRRIDLEVILARMNFLSGSREEAISTSKKLLERYPFCIEANRILQEIYLSNKDTENASICRNRLISLDPYYRYAKSPFDDQEVPDNKILLEKLAFTPSENIDFQIPAWKNTIEDSPDFSPSDNLEWIQNFDKQTNSNQKTMSGTKEQNFLPDSDVSDDTLETSELLPDWMKQAGWSPKSDSDTSEVQQHSESDQSDLPDWIKNDELDGIFDPESYSENTELNHFSNDNNNQTHATSDDLASLFSELKEGKMSNENVNNNEEPKESSHSSDWMSQFSGTEPDDSSSQSQELPEWLSNFSNEDQAEENTTDDMPDWLKNLQTEVEPLSQDEPSLKNVEFQNDSIEDTSPINIKGSNTNADSQNQDNPLSGQEIESNNGWEKIDLSQNEVSENVSPFAEETIPSDEKEPASEDTIPDWVKSVLMTDPSINENITKPAIQTGPLENEDTFAEETIPVAANTESDSPSVQSDAGIISQQTNDELLDWLRGLKEEETNAPSEEAEQDIVSEQPSSNDFQLPESLVENLDKEIPQEGSSENVMDLTEQIMANQLLPIQDEAEKSGSIEKSFSEKTLEDELSSLFNDQINNEVTESVLTSQKIEENDNVAPIEPVSIQEDQPNEHQPIQDLQELLQNKSYDSIPDLFLKCINEGQDFDQLIESIRPENEEQAQDFEYWQCLGDILSKSNKLDEALSAYQKAEDILLTSIIK